MKIFFCDIHCQDHEKKGHRLGRNVLKEVSEKYYYQNIQRTLKTHHHQQKKLN
jgi:hypothetical protein